MDKKNIAAQPPGYLTSKILVTGSYGMLGQDLCPTLSDNGYDVIETDKDSFDITKPDMVENFISKKTPDIIIHCAAYTNVDGAEEDFMTAELINVKGTENLAKVCAKNNVPLVYISTDYVFDGEKNTPYTTDDEPNPINIYGKTKLGGEEVIKKYCAKYYIIRTSWLYGHHGKNFVETMLSLRDNSEIKVVDDQKGCPTWTMDLSDGIIKIINNETCGTYHVCGNGETSWFEFAKEVFKQAGISVNIVPCTTSEFPRPAKRPKYSVMDNNGICRDWKLALKDYLNLRYED